MLALKVGNQAWEIILYTRLNMHLKLDSSRYVHIPNW